MGRAVKASVWISAAMMLGAVALAVGVLGINLTSLLVTCIFWTIIVALAPFGIWQYNRVWRAAKAAQPPAWRTIDVLKKKPRD